MKKLINKTVNILLVAVMTITLAIGGLYITKNEYSKKANAQGDDLPVKKVTVTRAGLKNKKENNGIKTIKINVKKNKALVIKLRKNSKEKVNSDVDWEVVNGENTA